MNCKYCKATFFDNTLYEEHLKNLHHKIQIFRCKKCPDEKFKGIDEFDKHLKYVHNSPIWDIKLGLKQVNRMFENDPYFQKLERQKLCAICGSQSTIQCKVQKGIEDTAKFVCAGACKDHEKEVKQMLSKEYDDLYG